MIESAKISTARRENLTALACVLRYGWIYTEEVERGGEKERRGRRDDTRALALGMLYDKLPSPDGFIA